MMHQEIFENGQISLEELPSTRHIDYIPIEAAYRTIRFIGWGIAVVVIAIGMNIAFWQADVPLLLWVGASVTWLIFGGIQFIVIARAHKFKGFALRRHDLTYRKGWLYKKEVTVPYKRIQHVDVKQGFIERQYDLAKLNLYTAGGNSSDLTVPGLRLADAQQFKSYILGVMRSDEEE